MGLANLGLRALSFGANPLFQERDVVADLRDVCVVWTVVESPVYVNTCFSTGTTATLAGQTTIIPSATCIDTILTSSSTINSPTRTPTSPLTLSQAVTPTAPSSHPITSTSTLRVTYTTYTTNTLITTIPTPTTLTHGTQTYTVTASTVLTITGNYSRFLDGHQY